MGCGGSKEAAIDLATVARNPAAFVLILSGHHDHPACNGTYVYDGVANGKPQWAKEGGGREKVEWTGRSWDCVWGGYSPEATVDTPVPPLAGYNEDRGGCDIKVRYQRVGRSMGCCASTASPQKAASDAAMGSESGKQYEGTTAVFATIPAAGEVTAETFAALKPSVKRMFTREKDGAAEGAYGLSFALVGEEVRGVLFYEEPRGERSAAELAKEFRELVDQVVAEDPALASATFACGAVKVEFGFYDEITEETGPWGLHLTAAGGAVCFVSVAAGAVEAALKPDPRAFELYSVKNQIRLKQQQIDGMSFVRLQEEGDPGTLSDTVIGIVWFRSEGALAASAPAYGLAEGMELLAPPASGRVLLHAGYGWEE